jgi:hypothetical protein
VLGVGGVEWHTDAGHQCFLFVESHRGFLI